VIRPPSDTRTHARSDVLRSPPARVPVPLDQPPGRVRAWFDDAAAAIIPDDDGTLATARISADAYARRATAANTRRAYRAGVRAEVAPRSRPPRSALPARAADVVACRAAERGRGRSVTTVELRRAAIRTLHFICGCAVPTAEAQVAETMAGMHRTAAEAGRLPARKLAATADILRQILEPIPPDLAGLRDHALRLTLPHTKGERTGRSVSVAIPYGTTDLCPIRALRAWQDAAGITEGAAFRRIWTPPRGRDGLNTPSPASEAK
jgi:hypothetical protein